MSLFEIVALSVPDGTMWHMVEAAAPGGDVTVVSHAGVPLTRAVTFRDVWARCTGGSPQSASTCSITPSIEDLNAAGMPQLRSLARHVSDASVGEFRRQLEYKTAWYGTELVVADRWFPSSKTCSGCGAVDPDLTLSDRTYACTGRGLVIDRDLNAAINLARYTTGETPQTSPPLPTAG